MIAQVSHMHTVNTLESLGFSRVVIAVALTTSVQLPIGPLFSFTRADSRGLTDQPLLSMAGLPIDMSMQEFRLLCVSSKGYRACSLQSGGTGYCWFSKPCHAEAAMSRIKLISVSPTTPCPLIVRLVEKWDAEDGEIPTAFH